MEPKQASYISCIGRQIFATEPPEKLLKWAIDINNYYFYTDVTIIIHILYCQFCLLTVFYLYF